MSSVPDNSAAPEHAVEIAYSYLGLPYVFGGGDLDGPTNGGFDRAGFTRRVVYAATGTDIGRTLDVQLDRCTRLPAGEIAQPGDILFWTSPGGFQRVHQQAFYTGMMTVIALIPEDLVTPGAPFDTRVIASVMGTVFHEQTVERDLITTKPPDGPDKPEIIIARPPYSEHTSA
ncbi:peptidoglycan endopeptidase [Mycobacterium sp. 050272]|uniref:C40 family peptidase n=1 Tax=Mycobacterium sp. 050272 TaxID=3142488 RepID=UPI003197C83E